MFHHYRLIQSLVQYPIGSNALWEVHVIFPSQVRSNCSRLREPTTGWMLLNLDLISASNYNYLLSILQHSTFKLEIAIDFYFYYICTLIAKRLQIFHTSISLEPWSKSLYYLSISILSPYVTSLANDILSLLFNANTHPFQGWLSLETHAFQAFKLTRNCPLHNQTYNLMDVSNVSTV